MNRQVVVDSSVAFKWFAPTGESGCDEALGLIADHRANLVEIAAPTLMRLEVLNGFWKRKATAADLTLVESVLDGFGLHWFEIDSERAASAARIAATYRLTVYDSLFVALALELDVELVTADATIIAAGACRTRSPGPR